MRIKSALEKLEDKRSTSYFFGRVHDDGIRFIDGNGHNLSLGWLYTHQIENKMPIGDLLAKRIYQKDDAGLTKRCINHYLPDDSGEEKSRIAFFIEDIGDIDRADFNNIKLVGYGGAVYHLEKGIVEFAGTVVEEGYRGLGKILTNIRLFKGSEAGCYPIGEKDSKYGIVKSAGSRGIKHVLKMGFTNPLARSFASHDIAVEEGMEVLNSIGYDVDERWVWNRSSCDFYNHVPLPRRDSTDSEEVDAVVSELSEIDHPIFVRRLDYDELRTSLMDYLSSLNNESI